MQRCFHVVLVLGLVGILGLLSMISIFHGSVKHLALPATPSSAARDTTSEDPVRNNGVTEYRIRKDPVKHVSVTGYRIRKDPVKHASVTGHKISKHPVKHVSVTGYKIRKDPVRNDGVTGYPISKDPGKHVSVTEYPTSKDPGKYVGGTSLGNGHLSPEGNHRPSNGVFQSERKIHEQVQNQITDTDLLLRAETESALERRARVSHLRQACLEERKEKHASHAFHTASGQYLQAPSHKLVYCPLEKVASSFWKRAMLAIVCVDMFILYSAMTLTVQASGQYLHAPSYKLVYCPIEKVASSFWKRVLLAIASGQYLQAPSYKLVYCPIEKVASSFWKRVMLVLEGHRHLDSNGSVFDLSSVDVHRNKHAKKLSASRLLLLMKPGFLMSAKKFLFVRDPYERLFSGFVDKLLAVTYETGKLTAAVWRSQGELATAQTCNLTVTFEEFVAYLVRGGKRVDIHFRAMVQLCPPCFLQYDVVGKLETFKEDVNYVLTSVGVDPSDVLGSESSFDNHSDVNIMYDVTKRTFSVMRSYKHCMDLGDILRRTWLTLQVRGFLSIDEPFPLTNAEAKEITLPAFWSHVTRAYARSGPREVRMLQRKSALMEAYHDLPRRLLKKLEDYVATDCRMFSYHCDVDSRFDPDSVAEPVFHFNRVLKGGQRRSKTRKKDKGWVPGPRRLSEE